VPESREQTLIREKLGLRVGPEMARYISGQLALGHDGTILVIGGDARTGRPMRIAFPAGQLRHVLAAEAQTNTSNTDQSS